MGLYQMEMGQLAAWEARDLVPTFPGVFKRLMITRVPSLGYQESSGNEDLIDILTRIMLYLSKAFDIKNQSFK